METPTLQKIRRKASRLLEDRLLRTGTVLAIRKWDDSSFVEIDLHLPAADMQLWQEVPFIKFRVDDFTYRYYTPSGWDAETRTCTIYADTGHEGPGAAWIRQLHKLDTVYYIRIGTTHNRPEQASHILALGDSSSLGHLLALGETVPRGVDFASACLMEREADRMALETYFQPSVKAIAKQDPYGHYSLNEWLLQQRYHPDNYCIYLAGNNVMVSGLHQLLRQQGHAASRIKVLNFWS